MRRMREWLWQRFLPAWCRDDLLDRNRALQGALQAEQQEAARLRAYIDGMQAVLRRQQGVTVRVEQHTGGVEQ